MISFSYFVLYLTVTFQAECKKHHKTEEYDRFRRLYDQIKPPLNLPTLELPRFIKLNNKMLNFEVFKNKIQDFRNPDDVLPPFPVKADQGIKKQELRQETQSIQRAPEVLVKPKQLPEKPRNLREKKKSQGIRNAKKLLKTPKVINEQKKKAIRARYYQREKNDVLDIEKQKVEELKQKVKRLRTDLRHNNPKYKAKQLNHTTVLEGKLQPQQRSNQGHSERKRFVKRMRKKPSTTLAALRQRKSRFFVQSNTEKTTSTSGTSSSSPKMKKSTYSSLASDEEPVMRGAEQDFEDEDEDDELNFDVEGELLSHIVT